MGGLGHYLEDEGLPTVQISLIREHTEAIRPPRALWVPFALGRPLGVPGNADFQKRVLRAALALLEAPSGPLLVDYEQEAPGDGELEGWVCPVNFGASETPDSSLGAALRRDLRQLRPWYDLALERLGRTTVGASGLTIDQISEFLLALAEGDAPANPLPAASLGQATRLAADDLKAYCYEAASAQPGQAPIEALDDWFWTQTAAARLMVALRERCRESDDPSLTEIADNLVPEEQAFRLL